MVLPGKTSLCRKISNRLTCLINLACTFIGYLTVWVVEPVVTHQTSWFESTGAYTYTSSFDWSMALPQAHAQHQIYDPLSRRAFPIHQYHHALSAAVKEAVVEGHVAQPHVAGQSTAAELARTPSTDSQGREAARADTPEAASDREPEAEGVGSKAQHRGRSKGHKLPPGVLLQSHAIIPALYMHPSAISATICSITLHASTCITTLQAHAHSCGDSFCMYALLS